MANNTLCIYCGERPGNHRDHVPPENLFPDPKPDNFITVPSCQECNGSASKDDEYFRFAITARRDLDANPAVKLLRAEVFAGLDRPESAGFRQAFVNSTRTRPTGPQMLTNCDRLNRVATRTVRALHYRKFAKLLPAANVDSFYEDSFDPTGIQPALPLTKVLKSLREEPLHVIHPDIFEYQYTTIEGRPDASAYLLTFFNRAWFLVLVGWRQPVLIRGSLLEVVD